MAARLTPAPKCPPGCSCGKHAVSKQCCPVGCTCGRHRTRPGGSKQPEAARPERVFKTTEERRQTRRQTAQNWRDQNRDKVLATKMKAAHGVHIFTDWSIMWDRQEGRCYLCGRELSKSWRAQDAAYVDHDHACCPQKRSCRNCRRGLACLRCNLLIGKVNDDADLLIKIAQNLKAARIFRDVVEQATLFETEA